MCARVRVLCVCVHGRAYVVRVHGKVALFSGAAGNATGEVDLHVPFGGQGSEVMLRRLVRGRKTSLQ